MTVDANNLKKIAKSNSATAMSNALVNAAAEIERLHAEMAAVQRVCEINLIDAQRYRALRDEGPLFSYDDDKTVSPWIVLGTSHADARPPMNSPSQEELIALAEKAGVNYCGDMSIAGITFSSTSLTKFAQLLLQREGGARDVACNHCGGSGSVEVYESVDPATRSTTVDCQKCKGNGYTIESPAQQPTAPGGEVVACQHTGNRRVEYDHIKCLDCGHVKTDLSQDWGISRDKWFASLEIAKFYQTHGYLPAAPSPAKEQG